MTVCVHQGVVKIEQESSQAKLCESALHIINGVRNDK